MDGSRRVSIPARIRRAVGDFFYAEQVPYGLALVRILLPLTMLVPMLQRWPHVRELYSADGAVAQLSLSYNWGNLMPVLPGSVAVALFGVMLFCLLASVIGWRTRMSLIIGTTLLTYFNLLDSVSTITKYSCIAIDAMIVLCLSNCGAVWSIDSRRTTRNRSFVWPGDAPIERPRCAVWPARLIQILIGSVYFGAAVTKMQTSEFFSGDQMRYWMLSNFNFDNPVGEWMAMRPSLLIVSAYATVIWEILFLFVVWKGWPRPVMLGIGAFFHLMTCLTLGLYIFPMVCLSIYFVFLTEDDVRTFAAFVRRQRRRWHFLQHVTAMQQRFVAAIDRLRDSVRIPGAVVHSLVLAGTSVLAVEVEFQMDPYGKRRSEGPHALTEMDAQTARRIIRSDPQLREKDKFFSFRVGSVVIGGILANDRRDFQHGECLLAQCALNPPHGDLWVECNLHDSEDHVVERVGQIVSRELMRTSFYYNLSPSLEPGEYQLVFRSSGQEVGRRAITLSAPEGSQLAN